MALQLDGDNKETVVSNLLKSYIARIFSQEAAQYECTATQEEDGTFGMAIRRIPKWAKKPTQINHKIIRAYFQLAEKGVVTYNMLADYCGEKNNSDVYVSTFASNFAQMKFDGEKSHGKVFEVDDYGVVTIWEPVEECLEKHKKYFLLRSTETNYIDK